MALSSTARQPPWENQLGITKLAPDIARVEKWIPGWIFRGACLFISHDNMSRACGSCGTAYLAVAHCIQDDGIPATSGRKDASLPRFANNQGTDE